MVISLDDKWIWDSWFARDGDKWHAFFLQADKSLGDPDLRHFGASHGHAISDDLINWTHLGTCLSPASQPAFDDLATWTGSVVQGDDGDWHLFYTGSSKAEDGLYQRIGHAKSNNLHDWRRVGDGLCLDLLGPNAIYYETEHLRGHWHDRAMRDPWVMRDPGGSGWLMFFTARVPDAVDANSGGAIGLATSDDLAHWQLQPPVFSGGFGQLEVPQVLKIGQRWYLLFCTAAEHWSESFKHSSGQPPATGSHYLLADDPRGPWSIATGPILDAENPCHRYASHILKTDYGRVILGFADGGREDFGGYVMDPAQVCVGSDGTLAIVDENKGAE